MDSSGQWYPDGGLAEVYEPWMFWVTLVVVAVVLYQMYQDTEQGSGLREWCEETIERVRQALVGVVFGAVLLGQLALALAAVYLASHLVAWVKWLVETRFG